MVRMALLLAVTIIGAVHSLASLNCSSTFNSRLFDPSGRRYDYHLDCEDSWDLADAVCTDATDTIRRDYCPSKKDCQIQFYIASEGTEQEQEVLSFQPAAAEKCAGIPLGTAPINAMPRSWHDICVGDFARCYSLQDHKNVYAPFFCTQGWEIPKTATHMSVDCTADRRSRVIQRKKRKAEDILEDVVEITLYVILGIAVLVGLYYLRKLYLRRMERAARDDSGEFTVCSFMLCGYWCVIKKIASSPWWESKRLMQMHGTDDFAEGTVEMPSTTTTKRNSRAVVA